MEVHKFDPSELGIFDKFLDFQNLQRSSMLNKSEENSSKNIGSGPLIEPEEVAEMMKLTMEKIHKVRREYVDNYFLQRRFSKRDEIHAGK